MARTRARLLDSGEKIGAEITITTEPGETISITYSDFRMAETEYTHIRSRGTYGGQWIKAIEFERLK